MQKQFPSAPVEGNKCLVSVKMGILCHGLLKRQSFSATVPRQAHRAIAGGRSPLGIMRKLCYDET